MKIIAVLIFSVFINILGQENIRPLAEVGKQIITVDEYRDRFEFMPHLNFPNSEPDSLRKMFLYSLIAERLWAIEALELNIDTSEIIQKSLKSLQKLLVRDELFRREVESKINLSQDEIKKGLTRIGRNIKAYVITSKEESEIKSLFVSLSEGCDFDSLLKTRAEYDLQESPITVKLGSLEDENIEDSVFSLRINQICGPVNSKDTWYIFKVVSDEVDSSLMTNSDMAREKTISILSERRRRKTAGKYLDEVIGGRVISADRSLFDAFSDGLRRSLLTRIKIFENDSSVNIQLIDADLIKTSKMIDRHIMNSKFIEIENQILTLTDFTFYLFYQRINFSSVKSDRIKAVLGSSLKQFIEDEMITIEGYKRDLDKTESVKKDLEIWKNYYLAETLLRSLRDSIKITDKDINQYGISETGRDSSRLRINIIEILTDNLMDVETILDELQKGRDFKELAEEFNMREYTKKSGGEWGYFSADAGGEIGSIASGMEIGQIYGPIRVPEGYSIIKLIDKKKSRISNTAANDESIKLLKTKIALSKLNNLINQKTSELSNKYGVSVNEDLLESIELSEVNMFTYRLIGFGGKIAALPLTIPLFEWYRLTEQKPELP